jgi:hypothetical protein
VTSCDNSSLSPLLAGAQLLDDVDGTHTSLAEWLHHPKVASEHRSRLEIELHDTARLPRRVWSISECPQATRLILLHVSRSSLLLVLR